MRFCVCVPKPDLQESNFNLTIGQIEQSANNYESINNTLITNKKDLLVKITKLQNDIKDIITQINKRLTQLGTPIITSLPVVSDDLELKLFYDTLKTIKSYIEDNYDSTLPSSNYIRGKPFYDGLDSIIVTYFNTTSLNDIQFKNNYNDNLNSIRNDFVNIHNSDSYDILTFKAKLIG